MDSIRHVEQEETVDLHARSQELRAELNGSCVIDGDGLVLAGAVRISPRGLTLVGDDGLPATKRRMSELTSRLRDLNDGLGASMADERLAALVQANSTQSELGARLDAAKQLGEAVDRALEALALLEETPAVEVDFARLHRTLAELMSLVAAPLAAPLSVTHVVEAPFRI